jgi:hypothetical protein
MRADGACSPPCTRVPFRSNKNDNEFGFRPPDAITVSHLEQSCASSHRFGQLLFNQIDVAEAVPTSRQHTDPQNTLIRWR